MSNIHELNEYYKSMMSTFRLNDIKNIKFNNCNPFTKQIFDFLIDESLFKIARQFKFNINLSNSYCIDY